MSPQFWVDTSFLYALFVEADQYHQSAADIWAHCVRHRPLVVSSNLVVAEFGTLLAYRFGHETAHSRTRILLETHIIRLAHADTPVERGAIAWWKRFRDQRFSMTDCVSFEFMRMLGVRRAFSYDLDFSVAGYETVREPEQLA